MRQPYRKNYSTALRNLTASAIGSVFIEYRADLWQNIFSREHQVSHENLCLMQIVTKIGLDVSYVSKKKIKCLYYFEKQLNW